MSKNPFSIKTAGLAVSIHLMAFGVAQAQTITLVPATGMTNKTQNVGLVNISSSTLGTSDTQNSCRDRAKEAARRAYGYCLADLKSQEIKEMKKWYLKNLNNMKQDYEAKLAELRKERDQLRKGILPQNSVTQSNTTEEATPAIKQADTQGSESEVKTTKQTQVETAAAGNNSEIQKESIELESETKEITPDAETTPESVETGSVEKSATATQSTKKNQGLTPQEEAQDYL